MATRTHSPFETLARVIEHLDDDGRSVRRTEAAGSGGDGSLRATVTVAVGAPGDLEPADVAVGDGLSVTFRAPAFPDPAEALPAGYPRVSVDPTDVRLDGDSLVVTLTVTIGDDGGRSREGDTVGGDDASSTTSDEEPDDATTDTGEPGSDDSTMVAGGTRLAAVRDESVPAYDDTPYLRRLYETSETFAEMSRRIDMDVSAETVRRYMTEAGVHSPTSYETADGTRAASDEERGDGGTGAETATDTASVDSAGATDGTAEPAGQGRRTDDGTGATSLPDEQLVADGIGLPDALTLHDVVDAVVDARTVHEVQREVGLEYDRTRQLLTQLNVLDLVVGRVSGDPDQPATVNVVADRIRQCAPDSA
ncbi:hypothetical protein GCM10008995_00660 [Halobellus salinus]|uniref:Uncharacterized protein n=1 Tax=Halobellus salinus TaxID=931585 RepID=A0A830E6K0_9EURY|nr:hypothetical protein [Halobellus salinus]GGI94339.1 hypothetical protein GCM10008995_00660 [Halobellus salinus]SMP19793.1 hypothetical protein SAMN06265347_10769 [Halobellus salinus]